MVVWSIWRQNICVFSLKEVEKGMVFLGELRFKLVKGEFLFSFQEFGDIVICNTMECFGICVEDVVYKSMICRI